MEAPNKEPQSPEKRRSKNDRRFSDEQIKSLESIFNQESKLESRKKLQLALDLGLQPRQVAIWFQNRRARWKTRKIEQEYKVLKVNYDSLCGKFDHLKKENQSLQMQLQKLSDVGKILEEQDLNDHRVSELKENILNDEKVFEGFDDIEENEEELASWVEDRGEINRLDSPQTWRNLCSDGQFVQSSYSIPNWWENE